MGNDRAEGTSSSDASGNPSAIVFSETHQLLHEAYPPSRRRYGSAPSEEPSNLVRR